VKSLHLLKIFWGFVPIGPCFDPTVAPDGKLSISKRTLAGPFSQSAVMAASARQTATTVKLQAVVSWRGNRLSATAAQHSKAKGNTIGSSLIRAQGPRV
jgi:hypothetical protein